MAEILLKDEVFAIVGSAYEVYNQLGSGFLEAVYQEALELELRARGIPFEAQRSIRISYKRQMLAKAYIADLVCWRQIIVELKAVRLVTSGDEAQLLNYLRATGMRVGVLLNFGSPDRLSWRRRVL